MTPQAGETLPDLWPSKNDAKIRPESTRLREFRCLTRDFLGASTLDRRHQLCPDEVRLNCGSRPDADMGVVPIIRRDRDQLALGAARSNAVEGGMVEDGAARRLTAECRRTVERGETGE